MIIQDEIKSADKRVKLRKRMANAEKDEFCREVRLLLTPSSLTEFVRFSSFGDSRRCPPCGRWASRWRKREEGTERRTERVNQGEPRPRDISRLVKGKPTPSNVLIKATQIAGTLLRVYLLTRLPGNSIFAWPKRVWSKAVSSSSSILFTLLIVQRSISLASSHYWPASLGYLDETATGDSERIRRGKKRFVRQRFRGRLIPWRNGSKVSRKFRLEKPTLLRRPMFQISA